MSKKSFKYIYFFDTQASKVKRNYVTSACNKLEYIAKVIASLGNEVDILSMSQVIEDKIKLYPSETVRIADGITLHLPFSWGGNSALSRKIKVLWHLLNMFLYLLWNCGKKDTIIVYHSLGYFNIISWAKKIKGFRLILEVEEIYSDVSQMDSKFRKLEFRMFDIADAFILSNDLLDTKINKHHKPSIVIYGTYHLEPKCVEKFDDGKIHVVYAGTFDPNKGGAQIAIMATEYLPKNYHIHICGFGSSDDIEDVKRRICEAQSKSKASITYDGLKKGNEFIEFLQKCHIGLSTQKPEGEYNDTSFPSKVLTYMANGLAVVSIRIPVLEIAQVSKNISFYDIPSGEELAAAIVSCDINKSSQNLVSELNMQFKNNINRLLNYE